MIVSLYVLNDKFEEIIEYLGAACPLEILDDEVEYEFECELDYVVHPADPDVGYMKTWEEILGVYWTDNNGEQHDMTQFFSDDYLYDCIQDRKVSKWW